MTTSSWNSRDPEAAADEPEPCPRCECIHGLPGPEEWMGTPCPTCGRMLPLPSGLPGGTVLTILLSLDLLGQPIQQVWETARGILEDERLRTSLLTPIDPDTPDAYITINRAEVPDPVTPAVERVVEEERAWSSVGVQRLILALRKRRALLTTVLRETFGAGFQRDEARVAARLGFKRNTVRLAVLNKNLVRV